MEIFNVIRGFKSSKSGSGSPFSNRFGQHFGRKKQGSTKLTVSSPLPPRPPGKQSVQSKSKGSRIIENIPENQVCDQFGPTQLCHSSSDSQLQTHRSGGFYPKHREIMHSQGEKRLSFFSKNCLLTREHKSCLLTSFYSSSLAEFCVPCIW